MRMEGMTEAQIATVRQRREQEKGARAAAKGVGGAAEEAEQRSGNPDPRRDEETKTASRTSSEQVRVRLAFGEKGAENGFVGWAERKQKRREESG